MQVPPVYCTRYTTRGGSSATAIERSAQGAVGTSAQRAEGGREKKGILCILCIHS